MREKNTVENDKSRINLSRNGLGKNVWLRLVPADSTGIRHGTAETKLENGLVLASEEACLHDPTSSYETEIERSFQASIGEEAFSINEHLTPSFHSKPYAETKIPSRPAKNRNAVNRKKKLDARALTVTINLDMPGFQRLESVLDIFPVSRAAWYAGIAEGRYPAGIQIGKRSVGWSNASLKKLIEDLSNQRLHADDSS
jgi:prophage regulatory protein